MKDMYKYSDCGGPTTLLFKSTLSFAELVMCTVALKMSWYALSPFLV